MLPPFDYFEHRKVCRQKQADRRAIIENLDPAYKRPLTTHDRSILSKPIADLVQDVHKEIIKPIDVLRVYGKVALRAHAKTNCLTEIMLPNAEIWAEHNINKKGPLAGIPVSLKDSIAVGGYDVTVGYSRNANQPWKEDGAMVRLLKDAGAIPYVKTNLPISLLSFESTNDVWGRTTNPHNSKYSPGGSTGGEGALLALGGRIGIGSDVAGSVRAPAHFSGCYSLRCSTGRWPKTGMNTSMPGQEGVASVFSPMTHTLDDLVYFSRAIFSMQPWRYDHTVHPIPWRGERFETVKKNPKLRFGVLRTDGVVDPSPACTRALETAVAAVRAQGHEIVDIQPPSMYRALVIASVLLNSDGCATFASFFRSGEWNDRGAEQMGFYMRLPRALKYIWYLWVRYIKGDEIWAGLLRHWYPKTAAQQWSWVSAREAYRAEWHTWWNEQKLDGLLTPPNATPAVPHDGMHDAVSSCGYTFLFNLLDYPAGIIPVTHVDYSRDALPTGFSIRRLNGVARGAYKHYDAAAMHGLPVAVQVVGQRLEEEATLAMMECVEEALEKRGEKYVHLEID